MSQVLGNPVSWLLAASNFHFVADDQPVFQGMAAQINGDARAGIRAYLAFWENMEFVAAEITASTMSESQKRMHLLWLPIFREGLQLALQNCTRRQVSVHLQNPSAQTALKFCETLFEGPAHHLMTVEALENLLQALASERELIEQLEVPESTKRVLLVAVNMVRASLENFQIYGAFGVRSEAGRALADLIAALSQFRDESSKAETRRVLKLLGTISASAVSGFVGNRFDAIMVALVPALGFNA